MLRTQVKWDNPEKTIIYVEASQSSDGLDNLETVQQLGEMAASVNHVVNVILYVAKMHYVRPNYVADFESLAQKMHPRIGCFAIVNPDGFFKDVISIIARMSNQLQQSYFFADSVEQARQKLETVYGNRHKPLDTD